MRKIILFFMLLLFSSVVAAQEITIKVFYGEECLHCADEKIFLSKMQEKYPDLDIEYYEVWYNESNAQYFVEYAREMGVEPSGVPLTFIGNHSIIGYFNDDTTGRDIERIIIGLNSIEESVKYPFIGEINLRKLSLPMLTLVLGTLDGFNPCAMWALMFLLALLINTRDKKKIWFIGATFIAVSGIVYFMFLTAWLNAFLWLKFIEIIRVIIGIVAIGAGIYYLYDWWTYVPGVCKITKSNTKIMDFARKIVGQSLVPATFISIIVLAFTVNLIELVCSIGLPAIYTKILSMSDLSTVTYYLYLLAYTILFMIDDFIVFFIVIFTMKAVGFEGKFSKWIRLIGGLLILFLGLAMLFWPEMLMFG